MKMKQLFYLNNERTGELVQPVQRTLRFIDQK